MSKKFDIHEWIFSIKQWSLLFIPHLIIYLIYIIYILLGAILIQEIESDKNETSSSIKSFQQERERLLIKIIEKREILDLQQYTKYVYKHIRQYEEEMKKSLTFFDANSSLNFSQSLFLIGTTLTTIGSNEFVPKSKLGKFFLMIYTGFGIPLTLVFLIDLSSLIKQSIIYFYFYSSKSFLHIRRVLFFRLIEEDEWSLASDLDLTLIQLISTLFLYLLLGTYFISSKSFFESFYLSFLSLFTIDFHPKIYENKNFCLTMIYLFFGLAIVFLCIEILKKRMEIFLTNIGKKLSQNLLQLTQQMGFHDLTTDDLLVHSLPMPETAFTRNRQLARAVSLDQSATLRPIGIAEPLRRLSTGIIRAFKSNDTEDNKHADKSVQVSTIIRRCGRCAETSLPIRPMRKHSAISTSSSSVTENGSSCDEDDVMDVAPPNFDRIRQRRATLVAKTIINQLATQPRSSSIDELMPSFAFPINQRHRTSPVSVKCSVKVSTSTPPPESSSKGENQEEFSQISKQISSLLVPSDDEHEVT